MNRFVIIDGNAILHRAYHALPPLTTADGSIVNAVYGFASIVLKLWNDFTPVYMAVAFDRPAPTFRKKLYTLYQSKRPKMEDNLVSQIPKVHELVQAFDIPIFEKDGFEADDVIGTLVATAMTSNAHLSPRIDETVVVTGDRDLLQLVDDHVKIFMPTKGISEGALFGRDETIVRMGVPPEQIPDLKGLMGDASDNYPGVEGIGPKTAQQLLLEFGSVEHIYDALKKHDGTLDHFTAAVCAKLIKGAHDAALSKDLATVRRDAPIEVNFEDAKITNLNTPSTREELSALGFKSLLKRLTGEEEKSDKKVRHVQEKKKVGDQMGLF